MEKLMTRTIENMIDGLGNFMDTLKPCEHLVLKQTPLTTYKNNHHVKVCVCRGCGKIQYLPTKVGVNIKDIY